MAVQGEIIARQHVVMTKEVMEAVHSVCQVASYPFQLYYSLELTHVIDMHIACTLSCHGHLIYYQLICNDYTTLQL